MVVHRFDEFEFDLTSGRLFRGSARIPLSEPQAAILVCLITHAGQVVSTARLAEAGWQTQAITDDSIRQSISRLRKALGPKAAVLIENVPARGYRFTAPIERAERLGAGHSSQADLLPYRAFVQGRAELHTLNRDALDRARLAFEEALRSDCEYAPAHIGLANACALLFEASQIDERADADALSRAVHHASRATVLTPVSGDAWSTLAFALYLQGAMDESAAAARKAIALERDNWLHWLRFAFVSWGEDRIRAARTILALYPGLALAHWLIATVLIARGAFDMARDVLDDGCAAQDAQSTAAGSFPAVGLHLLRGLVLAAQRDLDAAADALTRELACAAEGQLYARQCRANTWYALGAVRLRQGRRGESDEAFANALRVAPAHLFTRAALGQSLPSSRTDHMHELDARLACAVGLARAGRHAEAAHAWRTAVTGAPISCAGWILPVEPLINPSAQAATWLDVLTLLRARAA